jgi:Domain of unknown function (DUF4266)
MNLKIEQFENLKMRILFRLKHELFFFTVILFLTSCQALKPYERIYVDDSEMQLGNTQCKNFEKYTESIREGATPTSGSKASGGCGCN